MKQLIIKILVAALALSAIPNAPAAPWDNGTTNRTVSIPGDYASLSAAAVAFNALIDPGSGFAVNANWTIELASGTYTEAGNAGGNTSVFFGNTIAPAKSVTLKPAAGATVTVNFPQTSANASVTSTPVGGIVIGSSDVTNPDAIKTTNNFIIDGSNSGSNSRDMTLVTAQQATSITQVIGIYGASSNGTVKNCILVNNCTVVYANAHCVNFQPRHTIAGADLCATGWTISNCDMNSTGSAQSGGVGIGGVSGTIGSGSAVGGITISGNTINARRTPIFLSTPWGGNNLTTTISQNILRITQTSSGNNARAIDMASSNGTTSWTLVISGNIDKLSTVNTAAGGGISAMEFAPVGFGTYNIYNNMISGFSIPNGTAADMRYRAIAMTSAAPNMNIYNNSIRMEQFNIVSGATVGQVGAIVSTASGTGTMNVQNNIIRMIQQNGIGIWKNGTGGAFTSNYNDIFTSPTGTGQRIGRVNATDYTVFGPSGTAGTWQNAGYDLNGASADPTVPQAGGSGIWFNTTNLHFNQLPGTVYTGITLPEIKTDIDGETRVLPYMGCDEIPPGFFAAATDWTLYN